MWRACWLVSLTEPSSTVYYAASLFEVIDVIPDNLCFRLLYCVLSGRACTAALRHVSLIANNNIPVTN